MKSYSLTHVIELKKYLSITDATYISFANYSVLENNSPNKFFDSLASGKLVISNTGGWIRELIENYSCGFYYHPEEPQMFIDQIKPFLKDQNLVMKAKKNARELALKRFERQKLTMELFNFLEI